jgi:hypothetical protein
MRRITGLFAIAAATASLLTGSANAATPEVTANFISTFYYKVGAGWVATVACRTVAVPTDPQVTALTTSVQCGVNETTRTEAMPGAVAVSEVVAATRPNFEFCVSGTASFLDTVTNDVFTVVAVPKCITFEQ